MPDLDVPQRQTPDSLMLTGFWYRVLPADRVQRNQLHKAMLLEIPLVLGARPGRPAFALRDSCPHRGMPLNCGKFDGENLDAVTTAGSSTFMTASASPFLHSPPVRNLKVDRIYAGSYPCEEQDGFIWIYIPDSAPQGAGFAKPSDAPEPAPVIEKFSGKYKFAYLTAEMPGSCRSRHHRPDGSCSRPVRPSGLVVAQPPQHSRKAKEFRADSQRISHERAHAEFELRALQIAAAVCRRRLDHHDD